MPLPLTVSCFSKIQIGFTFLVPAHVGSPGQRAVKRVCVCVCVMWHNPPNRKYKTYRNAARGGPSSQSYITFYTKFLCGLPLVLLPSSRNQFAAMFACIWSYDLMALYKSVYYYYYYCLSSNCVSRWPANLHLPFFRQWFASTLHCSHDHLYDQPNISDRPTGRTEQQECVSVG